MNRIEALIQDPRYLEYMRQCADRERDRVFCHHDHAHAVDTARCAFILFLLRPAAYPELSAQETAAAQELLYAAAFLHDIGRFREYDDPALDHAAESACLAEPLLRDHGFAAAEIALILRLIARHRDKSAQGLDGLLRDADKQSRPCLCCPALKQCKKFQDKRPTLTI